MRSRSRWSRRSGPRSKRSGRAATSGCWSSAATGRGSARVSIAAVQGDAVAGGCELALHCDLRIATDTARFAMPLARIGIAVPVTLTWKLVEVIGAPATRDLLFTGEPIGAEAALALGLVNRVVAAAELDT